MTSNMRRKTIINTMIQMALNITRVLLQHSPSPDERPLWLDGVLGGMPKSVFMTPGDSVRAGLHGAATMPPRSVWRCWVGAMECRLGTKLVQIGPETNVENMYISAKTLQITCFLGHCVLRWVILILCTHFHNDQLALFCVAKINYTLKFMCNISN